MKPKALVITGLGINGELEMAQSFRQNGADADLVHLEDLIAGDKKMADYQIMAFPGGFAYADDLGAGTAVANRIKNNLGEELMKFVSEDKLVFGICNGFQMMVNLGVLPGFEGEIGERKIALKHNANNHYQCRWVDLAITSDKCVWTKGIKSFRASVGHAEGNFFTDSETLQRLKDGDQIVAKYIQEDGSPAGQEFPFNPNGSIEDIAGICDATGRIFGMMPHPDRVLTHYHEDNWTLEKEKMKRAGKEFDDNAIGQRVYLNAVEYFS